MEGEVGLRKYVNEWLTLDKREDERMVDRLGWGGGGATGGGVG